jgi:ABC-type dipeptide/oligopeptide/nickel transport system permease subunit
VTAARALGAGDVRLILRSVLPNCVAPILVQTSLGLATAVLDAAGLSFLGLGAQPPTPEGGAMLSQGRELILDAPWALTAPGLAILFSVLGFNLVGDGLRDALDPRS